ncbi:MAG: pitrilysin family protein [Pseudomonadota bacterium]
MNSLRLRPSKVTAVLTAVVLGSLLFAGSARAQSVTLPEASREQLDNGVVLLVNEKHEVPLVGIELVLRGGGVRDAEGKAGTASLYAGLLERGAGARDAAAFAEAIASVGGRLSASAERERIRISAEFLARDFPLALELLHDMLSAPTLAETEFDTLRERQSNFILAAKDSDPGALMPTYAAGFLFAGHAYGYPLAGSENSLGSIGHADVLDYHANEVGGDRLIVSVSGNIDTEEVLAQLRQAFGDLAPAGRELVELPEPARAVGQRVLLIDKPDATQTYFWIGSLGVAIDYPERPALDIANTLFGGRFTSMLNTALRVESGLTYGARSVLIRPSKTGSLGISSYTRTDASVEAIDMALGVLRKLRSEGMDEDMLRSAQNYLLGDFPTRFETARQLARQFAMLEFYGLDGTTYIDAYADALRAVTTESVARVIASVYPAEDELVFVILGDAAAIREDMSRYGPLQELSITDPVFTTFATVE